MGALSHRPYLRQVKSMVAKGKYDKHYLKIYSEAELLKLGRLYGHCEIWTLVTRGVTLEGKYLVQNE